MSIIGLPTQPTDLSAQAVDLLARLNSLEDAGEAAAEHRRLGTALDLEPSYRWCYRHAGQVALGAGFEEELTGLVVLIDGRPRRLACVQLLDEVRGGWILTFTDGTWRLAPRYTVLDLHVDVP